MVDFFTSWSRLWAASFDMAKTARKYAETATASQTVIESRTGMIRKAMQSPLEGNYAELGRMVPEKLEAFSTAGAAMATQWWQMHAVMMDEAQKLTATAMRGRVLSVGDMLAIGTRGLGNAAQLAEQGARLGAGGIAPIHAKATSNARRLTHGSKSR